MIALCALFTALPGGAAISEPKAIFSSARIWAMQDRREGGFSGLEVSEDGTRFLIVSDRADLFEGTFVRESGKLVGIRPDPDGRTRLRDVNGNELVGFNADAEGLARGKDGRLYVSFEGFHRVLAYPTLDKSQPLQRPDAFDSLPGNGGIEALAIDAAGDVYAIPERSGAVTKPFPVWRFDGTRWTQPFEIPRQGGFLVVGADFGPDGRLYILEREFNGFGFRSRVRRFDVGDQLSNGVTLLESRLLVHDNLEGLAVWRDTDGLIRLTMISDNNFKAFQRSEFVEYRVRE